MLTLGLLAGEASGDRLGAGVMRELKKQLPDIVFVGVGGPLMLAEGLESLLPMDALAVNGFRDPIMRLPSLLRIFRRLRETFLVRQVDGFLGIDFNVFNFLLEKSLKRRGIKTAHYVSPSVYAWRAGRTRRVANSADLLLCLYPFEPAFYAQSPIEAVFVGHPLADEIEPEQASSQQQRKARQLLNLDPDRTVLAVLPGSRRGEVKLMAPHFIEAAQRFVRMQPDAQIVVPCLHESLADLLQEELQGYPDLPLVIHAGNARLPLQACDVALVKSGTSTLEAMLLHRPMVVSYRLGGLSYQLARRLLRTPYVALPNILAGKMLVPELLQHAGSGEALAAALQRAWQSSRESDQVRREFAALHTTLRQNADAQAAVAMVRFLSK